jgi:hypothetical protein
VNNDDLEYACESYFIELYRTHPALKGKNLRHFDEDRPAETNCIVVQAVSGNRIRGNESGGASEDNVPPVLRTDGGVPIDAYEVELTVNYRSPATASLTHNRLSVAAISDSVKNATRGQTTTEKQFDYFLIKNAADGNRDNTKNLRKVERKFNLIAVLK